MNNFPVQKHCKRLNYDRDVVISLLSRSNTHHCSFVLLQFADVIDIMFIFLFESLYFVISLTLH